MTRSILKIGVVLAIALGSGAAFADDPTGVLLQQRGQAPIWPGPGPLPAFTEGGACYQGMHSEPFPNMDGYRCVANSGAR
jgi:hypothetical protein